jgi:hypothetical protein
VTSRQSDVPQVTALAWMLSTVTPTACHEGREEAPAVIVAMGVPHQKALGSVRLTLGRGTTRDDVERAGTALPTSGRALESARTPEVEPLTRTIRRSGAVEGRRHTRSLQAW